MIAFGHVADFFEKALSGLSPLVTHRGTATLSDSHTVAGDLVLEAELLVGGNATAVVGAAGLLPDGVRVPSGIPLTIGGDAYTAAAEALVVDGRLALAHSSPATSTYPAGTSVVLADAVTWDLVALDALVEASAEARNPGVRSSDSHRATVTVLKSRLPGLAPERIRKMELTIDGRGAPVMDVVDNDPCWRILVGKGGRP